MTSKLLVLLLLSQAEAPEDPLAEEMEPPRLPRARRVGLLLALALLSTGCASLTPPPGREPSLRYTSDEATGPASAQGAGVESPRLLVSTPESETPERLHRRRASREEVTAAGADRAQREARQRALAAQLAFRGTLREVSGSIRRISGELARLNASGLGLASVNGVCNRSPHGLG